jgi:hypothetical protein
MAKKPKKNPKRKPLTPIVPPDAYVRLRTMLDSLEIGSIRYYLMAGDAPGKARRYGALDEKLMPIVKWLWGEESGGGMAPRPDVECPAGYIDCNGCCVPYPCPDPGTDPKPKPKPKPKP